MDGHILNPYSGRYVKIGSKVYNRLEREGIIKGGLKPKSNVVYDCNDENEAHKAKDMMIKMNMKPDNKVLKVNKNKVVIVNKTINRNDYRKKLVKSASEILSNAQKNTEVSKLSDDDLVKFFEKEMYKKLMFGTDYEPLPAPEVKKPIQSRCYGTKIIKPKKFIIEKNTTDYATTESEFLTDDENYE